MQLYRRWTPAPKATPAVLWAPALCLLMTDAVLGVGPADRRVEYTNPVYRGSMPDPGVFFFEGRYYALGTTGNERLADQRVFRMLSSENLVQWREHGGALKPPSDNPAVHYWAPEVTQHDGVFYLYYSAGTLDDLRFEIRVATSDRPDGPYADTGSPLEEGEGAKFFIDGHAFQDDDGSWYFFYAKNFLDTDDGNLVGTGVVVDRLIDMVRLEGKPKVVVRPRYEWTLFEAQRKMSMHGKRVFDWHTIEAPWVVKRGGKYYCFYSGSNFGTANYGVDYVVADSVAGPYADQGRYPRVLRGVPDLVRGPGHHSMVRSPAGDTDVLLYHAWDDRMERRELWIDPLVWTARGPVCLGPSVRATRLAENPE